MSSKRMSGQGEYTPSSFGASNAPRSSINDVYSSNPRSSYEAQSRQRPTFSARSEPTIRPLDSGVKTLYESREDNRPVSAVAKTPYSAAPLTTRDEAYSAASSFSERLTPQFQEDRGASSISNERRTAESIRRRREELSSSLSPPSANAARVTFSADSSSSYRVPKYTESTPIPTSDGRTAKAVVEEKAQKEDLAKKWLSAADGVLGKGPSTQERMSRLHDTLSTPAPSLRPQGEARKAESGLADDGFKKQSSSLDKRPFPPTTEEDGAASRRPMDAATQSTVSPVTRAAEKDGSKNKHSIYSDDSEEEDRSFAARKAERFLTKASTVLTEDKIVAQDPRLLFSQNCKVVLRSFRGTYLRWYHESPRALTGGTPFDTEFCEFSIEKVSSSPSKVLLFGDKVFIRDSRGFYLSGNDFTRDARQTWTIRRFVDRKDYAKPVRSYICSSDAVVLEYDGNKRVLGVPSAPHDGEGSSFASMEVSPLDESQKWFIVHSVGEATVFYPPDAGDSTIDDEPKDADYDPLHPPQAQDSAGDIKSRPVSASRYVLDVFLGLYPFSNRLENQIRTSEDILLIDRLRPVAKSLFFLRAYAKSRSQPEWGRVCQALCFHLQESVLDGFDDFIAAFNGGESLTMIFSAIQPRARIVLDWSRVLSPSAHLKGGPLLNELNAARVGNFENRQVCEDAIAKAIEPFLYSLYLWLTKGQVFDPYQEFCILENPQLKKEDLTTSYNSRFWTSKYSLREERTIPWLFRPYVDIILKTGRNRSVVQGIPVASDKDDEEEGLAIKSLKDLMSGETLQRMYQSASNDVLKVLRGSEHLMEHLVFLKKYFLLDHMDFFLHFMDVAGKDLSGPITKGTNARLRVTLQVALREYADEHASSADELTCVLLPFAIDSHVERIHNETDENPSANSDEFATSPAHLRGVDAFALDLSVRWPLSLILSKRTLTKYQLLFRHLFRCKHAEKRVGDSWVAASRRGGTDAVAQGLILRMTHFLQSLQYYTTFEVLEPRWRDFIAKANKAKDVDELLRAHEDMLDSCLRECLLTNPNLIRNVSRLLRLCLSLGDLLLDSPEGFEVRCDQIRVSEFDQELVSFLSSLKSEADKGQIRTEHLYNLATCLDFSDFYGALILANGPDYDRSTVNGRIAIA